MPALKDFVNENRKHMFKTPLVKSQVMSNSKMFNIIQQLLFSTYGQTLHRVKSHKITYRTTLRTFNLIIIW